MVLDYALRSLVTWVVDSVGIIPAFLSVTQGLPHRERRRVGFRASIMAAAILMGTALIGNCTPSYR